MAKKDERSAISTQTPLSREQLLELQLANQKVHRVVAQLESLSQRKQAINLELSIIPEKEKELQGQRDAYLEDLRSKYAAAKEQAGIPEGMEMNLETGAPMEAPKAAQ